MTSKLIRKDSSLLRDACFIGGRKHTAPANLEAWLRAPIVPPGTSFHRSVNAAGEYVEGSRRTEKLALWVEDNGALTPGVWANKAVFLTPKAAFESERVF